MEKMGYELSTLQQEEKKIDEILDGQTKLQVRRGRLDKECSDKGLPDQGWGGVCLKLGRVGKITI